MPVVQSITTGDVQLGLRLPRDLRDQLEQVAVEHQSSISGATRFLLRRALADFQVELAARRGERAVST